MKNRLFLIFCSVIIVLFFWHYLGEKATLKDNSNSFSKLQCVSYAPFGKDESPFLFDKGLVLKEENIKKDLELLSKYTKCIRTYSTVGLELIPKIAKDNGLKMLMGVWVSKDEKQSFDEIETLKKLASEYPEVIEAIIVGNEVLLRGDLSEQKLSEYIVQVKQALPNFKVTYADVWEYWLKYPKLKDITDFVTIHILPYWEDLPMSIDNSINHLVDVRIKAEKELGTSNILIGETGWPSEGRAREDAVPSRINQAKFVREFVKIADERNWQYNIIEAFDQPWKRVSEGAVGGFWGLFDKDRNDKNVFSGDVSNFPNYIYLAMGSIALIFAFSTLLRKKAIRRTQLVTFTIVNTIFSILYMLQVEQYLVISRNNFEYIWAILVLGTQLYIYYYLLQHIIDNAKELISRVAIYLSAFFVFIITNNLAHDGRYENFEIYGFILSSIALVWLLFGRFKEAGFTVFEKLLSLVLVLNALAVLYNETTLNIFSNIWFVIAIVFAVILSISNESILKVKEYIFYIVIFVILATLFKNGFVMNNALAITCNIDASSFSCLLRDISWKLIYFGYLGFAAFILSIVALVLNRKPIIITALFVSIVSTILTNTFMGAVSFIIVAYAISKLVKKPFYN